MPTPRRAAQSHTKRVSLTATQGLPVCSHTERVWSTAAHQRVVPRSYTVKRHVLCAVTQRARKAQPPSASVVCHTQPPREGAVHNHRGWSVQPNRAWVVDSHTEACRVTQHRGTWRAEQHHVRGSRAATQVGHTVSAVCRRTEEVAAQGHTVVSSVQAHGECSATQW